MTDLDDRKAKEFKRMTEKPVFGLVLRLCIPTTCSMLITSIYNIVDTLFVSSLGNTQTAAVGVVYSIQSIIQAVGFGFGMGAQSLISRLLGQRKNEEADLYASSGFVAAFLIGFLIMIAGLVDLPFVMHLFGATDTALPLACEYGRIILIGAPVFCSSFVINNVLRAEGKAAFSMVGLCSGGVFNILLDYTFIVKLRMGVTGAALATILSQLFSFSILISFFIRKKSAIRLNITKASRNIRDYLLIIKTGLPTVFRQSLGSLATTLLYIAVRPYGDAAMAAVSIVNKVYMLIRSSLVGIGQGFQPVAGYNYGAKLYERVRQAFKTAILIGTVYGITMAFLVFMYAGNIMAVFRPGDVEVIGIGEAMFKFLSIPLIVLGYSTFINQLYQSLGFVVPATFLASLRQGIFFIPLILILPACFGLLGIQIAQSVSDMLTFLVSIPFHYAMFRKYLPVKSMNNSNVANDDI